MTDAQIIEDLKRQVSAANARAQATAKRITESVDMLVVTAGLPEASAEVLRATARYLSSPIEHDTMTFDLSSPIEHDTMTF